MYEQNLVAAGSHALLVVAGGLVVGVDDGVGGDAVGIVGLGPLYNKAEGGEEDDERGQKQGLCTWAAGIKRMRLEIQHEFYDVTDCDHLV